MTRPFDFDAWAEAANQSSAASPLQGISFVAFAALAVALGCPPDEVERLYQRMWAYALPSSAQDAIDRFRAEIEAMPHRHWPPREAGTTGGAS